MDDFTPQDLAAGLLKSIGWIVIALLLIGALLLAAASAMQNRKDK